MFYNLEKKGPLKKLDSPYGFRQEFVMSCNYHATNEPYTTMKWSDGSVTTAKCSENETFSKEVGVAMCISKKYLECRGFESPRKGFKSIVENGVDLKGIHDKRDRKKALKRAIDMAKAGYSMDEIKNTLNLTDDDVLDLFKDESAKE